MDLSAGARAVAHAFRVGETARANDALLTLIEALEHALPTLSVRVEPVLAILQLAHEAQARGDTLLLADLLEHELPKRL